MEVFSANRMEESNTKEKLNKGTNQQMKRNETNIWILNFTRGSFCDFEQSANIFFLDINN